jgi:glycogen operon protein
MNAQEVPTSASAKNPEIWLGNPYPLGATWAQEAVNFAVFSETANGVDLCLFDSMNGAAEQVRIPMAEQTDQVWHMAVPGLQPGQLYGYRFSGPYEPERGSRFNSSKLLIDPYAKAVAGDLIWSDDAFGYPVGNPAGDLVPDHRDDGWCIPRSVVIDSAFDWDGDKPPRTPLHSSIIYEAHVKGFTQLNPSIPQDLRGTYAGLGSPVAIEYLQSLGVTAVELLPVHHHVDERPLVDRGLKNYWGYNTVAFFAPDARFSSSGVLGEQVQEFKTMVKSLHAAGIEVILDVVYNHTAEGNHLGPTLGFRSVDNQAYREHGERHPSARSADDHGQPSLLGDRDARRRFPL